MLSNKKLAFISIFIANLIYGVNYAIAKAIMPEYFSPLSIIFLRILGTVIISGLIFITAIKQKVENKDLLKIFLASIFGIAINQVMFFEGLNLTTPIDASIIMTINPIIVLIFSFYFLKNKITLFKIIGIILGIIGASVLILGKGKISFNSNNFSGNILIFINAVSFALYLIIIKPIINKYHPLTLLFWLFLFGFIITLPFTFFPTINVNYVKIPTLIWLGLLYVILFSTFIGYLLYNFSLKKLSTTVVSFFIYLQPIFSTIVSFFYFKQTPNYIDFIATALIFIGVWLVNK